MADHAPLPWSYETVSAKDSKHVGFLYLLDANGRKIGTIWGPSTEKLATADLIVDKVNPPTGD
jgi:hypothetical protein